MSPTRKLPRVTVVGGGMITRIQILPSLYQMQRDGLVGEIHICALNAAPLKEMQDDPVLQTGFAGHSFTPYPDPAKTDADRKFPNLYKQVLAEAPRGSIAVIAVPDQLHYATLREAIANDLHVCIVKPLVLQHAQAEEIARLAYERGLVIGVEYHKRFDHRSLLARQAYRAGRLGNFRLGQAQMIEPYYYRDSNFMNWATCENTDMFTYVGCHYVDLLAFITGLRPTAVSVYGIVDEYPNGNTGYLWTDARVLWENGGSLSIVDAIGYPNAAPGGNAQGLRLWCQGASDATLLAHDDQFRGVKYGFDAAKTPAGDKVYAETNPDYFQLVHVGGEELTPIGYGHRSVEYILRAGLKAGTIEDLAERQALLRRYDEEGIMATPANSSYNELVIEAGRMSIQAGGREVVIEYEPKPRVRFREY